MKYWLMKTEPSTFSLNDLKNRPQQKEPWDGIRNYQARNMMRDQMEIGDLAFVYHSNCKPPGIVGIVKIIKKAYPDHTAFNPSEKYYDPKSDPDNPRWVMVDVQLYKEFRQLISLEELKQEPLLKDMLILRKGNRLSITPVSKKEWEIILKKSK